MNTYALLKDNRIVIIIGEDVQKEKYYIKDKENESIKSTVNWCDVILFF